MLLPWNYVQLKCFMEGRSFESWPPDVRQAMCRRMYTPIGLPSDPATQDILLLLQESSARSWFHSSLPHTFVTLQLSRQYLWHWTQNYRKIQNHSSRPEIGIAVKVPSASSACTHRPLLKGIPQNAVNRSHKRYEIWITPIAYFTATLYHYDFKFRYYFKDRFVKKL